MILRINAAFVAKGTLDSRFKATVIGQVKQLVPPIAFTPWENKDGVMQ